MTSAASKSEMWLGAGPAHLKEPRGPVGCKRRVSLITDSSTGSLLKSAVSLLISKLHPHLDYAHKTYI